MVKATSGGGKTFRPCPEGVVQAVIVDVIDLGKQTTTFAGETKTQHKIKVMFQVDERRDDGQRFVLGKFYTLSLHEKATLRKDIEALRSKKFTEEEALAGFDVNDIIGWQAMVQVEHKVSGDNTYGNIRGVMPLPKGMPKLEAEPYERKAPKAVADPADDEDIPF